MLKDKVKIVDGCWIWQGAKIKGGYGKITYNAKQMLAHRLSYQLNIGDIPKGLCVCHKCDTPSCINPEHLFAGTHKENTRDMINKGRVKNPVAEKNALKTHCIRGHEFNEVNTKFHVKSGKRQCRTCFNDLRRVRRARRGQSGQCGGV